MNKNNLNSVNSENKLLNLNFLDFKPKKFDQEYLKNLGSDLKPSDEILHELYKGSIHFIKNFKSKKFITNKCHTKEISLQEPLKAHRYTTKCPIDVLEINPMEGCNLNCLYCLVTNGDHSHQKILYKNYGDYLKNVLEKDNYNDYYYYYSPKSEPFQEITLKNGIAHNVLRDFINYFKKKTNSKSKIFIVSKAGKEELSYKNNNDTIMDLLKELSSNLIYDVSISVVPSTLIKILEPSAPPNEKRIEASIMLQKNGIKAFSALVQPILPYYFSEDIMELLVKQLKEANITLFKPEFLTLSTNNLAWLGQIIGQFDKKIEKKLYDLYLSYDNIFNIKQNGRLAPDREYARNTLLKLKEYAEKYNVRMTLCNWVRSELNISESDLEPIYRKNKIFDKIHKIGVCKPV